MSFRENFAINVNYANHIFANEAKDKVKNLKDANEIKSFDMFGTATPPDSIYNKNFKESLTLSTPLMLTWGAQEGKDQQQNPTGKLNIELDIHLF